MKFTDYLFEEVKPIWEEYLIHPFIKEIADGTLDKGKFKDYLIQDYLYLKEYAKVFCVGVVKAQTMKDMKFFYKSIKGTMEDETAVHIKYLKDFGMEPEEVEKCEYDLTTSSYTSYMQALALTGDIREIAIATLPCTWSYNYIGKYLLENHGDELENNFYRHWIELYGSQGFTDFSDGWIEYTDRICENICESEKKKLRDIFIKASIYEMEFWHMAYRERK